MEMIACTCDEAYGLPHTHVGARWVYETEQGRVVSLDGHTCKLNADRVLSWRLIRKEEPSIHVWIDWKLFAEAVLRN